MFNALIDRNRDLLIFVARLFLVALFLISGWGKLMDFQGTVGYMASVNAPVPTLAAAIAVVFEFFVAIALLLGAWTRPLALLFALFVIGTGLIGHPFWTAEGADRGMQLTQFYKNLSIAGGFLLLAVTGAGRWAVMKGRA